VSADARVARLGARLSAERLGGLIGLLALAACSSSPGNGYHLYKKGGDAGATPPPPNVSTMPGGNPDVSLGMPSGTVTIVIRPPLGSNTLSVNGPADVSAEVTITGMGATDVVDPQSVQASIALAGTTTTLALVPLVGPTGAKGIQYDGRLPLAGLKTGKYTITVTARSSSGQLGSKPVDVNVDAGPFITVLSPLPGRHYKGSIVVLVAIDPDVKAPAAQIGATPVALAKTSTPGLYRAVFDLTLPIPLAGEQLFIVTAEGAPPDRITSTVKFTFDVDLVGPSITDTTPPPGTIVGGIITLGAKISDDAGLNDSTIQVLVGDNKTTPFRLAMKPDGAGGYSTVFDTNNLTKCGLGGASICIVRPSISFRASDNLGNETTVAYEIAVDNIPPVADMQPPKIRIGKLDEGYRCSTEIDPLDRRDSIGDIPGDLCVVTQLFDVRARIEDSGNTASGQKQWALSLVDENATAFYILDTVAFNGAPQPLVVDTDGDGYCDDINPTLQPTTEPVTGPKQVLKIRMKPVPPAGLGDFYPPDYTGSSQPATLPAGCLIGKDTDPPRDLCSGPQPTIAISYLKDEPAIWSIEPIAPIAPGYCFGSQLDTKANNIQPALGNPPGIGWKCLAVVTADKVGNRSTSAPLRVYLPDYQNGGARGYCPAVPPSAGPPPTCTGTYNRVTGELSPKACLTRGFKIGKNIEVCYGGNCGDPNSFVAPL
jgi:hypothetical protein